MVMIDRAVKDPDRNATQSASIARVGTDTA
jgi:hypothetical protein